MQRAKRQTLAPAAAAANNICLSQTPGGAGALTLNGSTVTGGVATLDMARRVLITCAGNNSARTFTITGTSQDGRTISEVLAGTNSTTCTSLKDYLTITSIVISGASTGALTVGTNGTAGATLSCVSSPWVPIDRNSYEVGFDVQVTGTVNYTVEYTMDNPFYGANPSGSGDTYLNPYAHPSVNGQVSSMAGYFDFAVAAVRLTINSYSTGGTAAINIRPAGSAG